MITEQERQPILTIGVVGGGFVGRATSGFSDHGETIRVIVYDLVPALRNPSTTTMADIYRADIVFVAVPTPMNPDGSCHISIVKDVVEDLKSHNVKNIVVRSTVPVGTCASLGVHFMPEFLTEKHWQTDFSECRVWVVGVHYLDCTEGQEFIRIMSRVLDASFRSGAIQSKNTNWITTHEAELVKYTRNCFLASKVGFFNELYCLCETVGIDYDRVRESVVDDPRIGPSHTRVPNEEFFNGRVAWKRGFSGTCFIKDTASLIHQFRAVGVPCPILEAVWNRNLTIDRPDRDWEDDKGRAVV